MKAKDYPAPVVEISCDHCCRYGKYRKERFVTLVGAETDLPQALSIVAADCPEDRPCPSNLLGRCRPRYANNWWGAGPKS